MAGTFPTLSSGQVCMYPATRTVSVPTRVVRFLSDREQRWRTGPVLNSWELKYAGVNKADRDAVAAFFDLQRGAADTSWSFPFLGTAYASLAFEHDDFTWTESKFNRYDFTLRFRQVRQAESLTFGGTAVFPQINGSVRVQLPWNRTARYLTTRNDMDAGPRHSFAWRTAPLYEWSLAFPVITADEVGTLLAFFIAMGGPYRTFALTDPDDGTTAHANCRFMDDEFRASYNGINQCSVTLRVAEFVN